MDGVPQILFRLRRLVASDDSALVPVDRALPSLLSLLRASGAVFRIVGGLAVIHHGYPRTTGDLDVLLQAGGNDLLEPRLGESGFTRLAPSRLRHPATGTRVHLLIAGQPMARPGAPLFPSPGRLRGSPRDPEYVSLEGLLELKLHAGRRQDEADTMALLKPMVAGDYRRVEAALPGGLRAELASLRRDAPEELSWEQP